MLSLKNLTSAADAVGYYQSVLDYYAGGNGGEYKVDIEWQGKAIQTLFGGKTPTMKDFKNLLEGKLPNGEVLGRREGEKINHRPGIDLTFSAPKSASILALIYGDKQIVEAHNRAVVQALTFLEKNILQTRVNGEPAPADRVAFAKFLEMLSRELDPQIHTHCVLLNFCQKLDEKFRCLHYDAIYDASMLAGVIYRSFLAIELQKLGYEIEITCEKGTFEIKRVPKEIIKLFSKRREQMMEKAFETGRFDAKHMDKINLATRKSKVASPLDIQQEKWKAEVALLAQNLGFDLNKGFEQFRTGPGFRMRDTSNIALEAVQAAVMKLDELKRMYTQREIIHTATTLTVGKKVLPKHVEAAFHEIKASGIIRDVRLNEHEASKRQEYYMSAQNAVMGHALEVHAQKRSFNLDFGIISYAASKWIITKDMKNLEDNHVYKSVIDFTTASSARQMIVDNLCPKTDKVFIARATDFASTLGIKIFHITASSIDRKICEQAGLKTWGLNYLDAKYVRGGSLLVVHGAEKLLNHQMRDIVVAANQSGSKIIWANDKDAHVIDRRLSPVEQIAPHVPRESFEVGLGNRLAPSYVPRMQSLGEDNFTHHFAKQYSGKDNTLLLSYQADTVNKLVREQLVKDGKISEGMSVTNYVHRYLSTTELSRASSYKVGDIIRLNNLKLAGLKAPSKTQIKLAKLTHNLIRYKAGDHFKVTAISGNTLTLSHGKLHSTHKLNLSGVTHFKDLTVFSERSLKVAVGDRLILPSLDVYGKDYQNKIGRVVTMNEQAITLNLTNHEKPFVLHLKDKAGVSREIYADYGYCQHPAKQLKDIKNVKLDCRAMHAINALKGMPALIDKNVTLYTDSPQGVLRALESIKTDLEPAFGASTPSQEKTSFDTLTQMQLPSGELKMNLATTALKQSLYQLTADGKTNLSQGDIMRDALSLCVGEVDAHNMRQGFKQLLESGEIIKDGKYFTASWVTQNRDALVEAFKGLADETGKQKEDGKKQPPAPPTLNDAAIKDYLKKNDIKLGKAPTQAITDLVTGERGLALLQGPAGSAKTSLVLRHVAGLFKAQKCKVIGIAPQHSQKDELAKKAGIDTMTIQKFLQLEKTHKLQDIIEPEKSVILVDESSMLSYKDMLTLTHIANRYSARMIFAGDAQQLDSPRSAQPFLHLQQQDGVQVAKLKEILRQCKIKRPQLHKAITQLTELAPGQQATSLTPYLRHPQDNKSLMDTLCDTYHKLPQFLRDDCLVLALTNAERGELNERLRIQGGNRFNQVMLENADLGNEQRYYTAHYRENNVIRFNKEIKGHGITAQSYWQVVGVNAHKNTLTLAECHINKNGELKREQIIEIDPNRRIFHRPNTLEYFEAKEQSFAVGEKVMLTNNIKHASDAALNTSKLGVVKSFTDKHFTIDFGNEGVVKFERNNLQQAHVGLGYARTYHNAQSLDARSVLMLANTDNRHMLNYAANYVGATRVKQCLRIFTQCKDTYLRLTQKTHHGHMSRDEHQKGLQPDKGKTYKREIDEAKLLSHLNEKIERHAANSFGAPKLETKDTLVFGSEDPKRGIAIITNDKDGAKRGDCIFGGIQFDFVALIEAKHDISRNQALKYAAEKMMGNPIEDYHKLGDKELASRQEKWAKRDNEPEIEKTAAQLRRDQAERQTKMSRAKNIRFAQSLYKNSQPAIDTPAEKYLVEHRKIPQDILRAHPHDIRHIMHNNHHALLFPLRDKEKNVQAVQLVYLDNITANKTEVTVILGKGKDKIEKDLAKQSFGPINGASIQLGNPYGIPHIAEGPETGLSVLAMNPSAKVHITCSLSNMANAPLELAPPKIIVCGDNDNFANKDKAAQKPLLNMLNKLTEKHWDANLVMPELINNEKTDFNDLLKSKNLESAKTEFEKIVGNSMAFEQKDFNGEVRDNLDREIVLKPEHDVAKEKLSKIINNDLKRNVELAR